MDSYIKTLNKVGESIIAWADPETKFTGHTDVSENTLFRVPWIRLSLTSQTGLATD
jgi:hypothetical protein